MNRKRWEELNVWDDVGMEYCSISAPALLKIELTSRFAISLMLISRDTGVLMGSMDWIVTQINKQIDR